MGFACQLFISGALTATYNINSGIENSPDRVCRGVAMTAAADSPVGTVVSSKLSENGVTVEGRETTTERLPDTDKGLINLRQSSQDGGYKERSISPLAVPALKLQLGKDTTRSGP